MKNRIMVYILILLGVVAIIYRIAHPPEPVPPGPTGGFPNWKSRTSVGALASQAVNPAGTVWAGVWNEKTRSGEMRSAVWIIDFKKFEARMCKLSDEKFAPSLGWLNDDKIWVLIVDSEKPASVTESGIQYINAADGGRDGLVELKTPITRVLAWPARSSRLLAALATEGAGLKVALLSVKGEVIGKEIVPDVAEDAEPGSEAAVSPGGEVCLFSASDRKAGGGRAFYLGKASNGASAHAFDLTDVPGRIEAMWSSPDSGYLEITGSIGSQVPARILMICSRRETFSVVVYNSVTDKMTSLKKGIGMEDLKRTWVGVPEKLMYVTYNGGYEINVTNGKAKKLFDYSELGRMDDYWREQVRNGRLYPVKNGYISVSVNAGVIDIRELGKDGRRTRDLLPGM